MNTNIDLIYDMFHLLANQHSLYELVDCASKILNNPLLIIDSTMNLLAVCGAEGIEDEIWNDFLAGNSRKKQYSDEKEIIETMQRVIFGNEILLTQYKNHQVNRIVSKITSSNKTLGFIVCLEHTSPFPENILKLTQIVCNAFAIELQREIILEEEIVQKKAIR